MRRSSERAAHHASQSNRRSNAARRRLIVDRLMGRSMSLGRSVAMRYSTSAAVWAENHLMNHATVLQADHVEHPESGRELVRITVSKEWASGGVTYPSTDIWAEIACPIPEDGETVEWDGHHVWVRGACWRKREYDSDPGKALA